MNHVTSEDGTRISYERTGSGPAVILVGGSIDDGTENAPLAAELATDFTVFNYARRGRGESGDTQPYAVQREIEDLAALVAEAGGRAHAYAVSSGGALALRAAADGVTIDHLAVYEVPYGWPPPGFIEDVEVMVAEGRRGDAVELFMRSAGSSDDDVDGAKSTPYWPALEALAHTLAYDAACLGDGQPPAGITLPTLVVTGGSRPDAREGMAGLASDFFDKAAEKICERVPHAQREVLEGQGHVVDQTVMSPLLKRFFRQ